MAASASLLALAGAAAPALGSWSSPTLSKLFTLQSISCIPPGGEFTCVANASVTSGPNEYLAMSTVLDHGDWTPVDGVGPTNLSTLSDPVCSKPSFCLAVGTENRSAADPAGTVAWLTFDGDEWDPVSDRVPVPFGPYACASPHYCVVVDDGTALTPIAAAAAFDGSTWSQLVPSSAALAKPLDGLSCVAVTHTCIAVGGTPGSPVAERIDGANAQPLSPPPGNMLDAISCPAITFCMAVGETGATVAFDPLTGEWGIPQTAWSAGSPGAGGPLSSVSCASQRLCVALDTQDGYALVYIDGAWETPDALGGQPQAVSCPTEQNCYVAAGDGTVRTYTSTIPPPAAPALTAHALGLAAGLGRSYRVAGGRLALPRLACPQVCGVLTVRATLAGHVVARASTTIRTGSTRRLTLRLSHTTRRLLAHRRRLRLTLSISAHSAGGKRVTRRGTVVVRA